MIITICGYASRKTQYIFTCSSMYLETAKIESGNDRILKKRKKGWCNAMQEAAAGMMHESKEHKGLTCTSLDIYGWVWTRDSETIY